VSASAAIALSKLAVDPLARANHTGTQLAATVSDFTEAAQDAIAAMIAAGTHTNITFTYDDTNNKLSATVVKMPVRFSATVPTTGATGTDRSYGSRTLTGARMRTTTAPVGSSLAVDVQSSTDGSSWTTQTTLTIAAGATTEATGSFSLTQADGNLIRLNVTSVGSTTPATGVVVDVLSS
jgi:hypothetical protein